MNVSKKRKAGLDNHDLGKRGKGPGGVRLDRPRNSFGSNAPDANKEPSVPHSGSGLSPANVEGSTGPSTILRKKGKGKKTTIDAPISVNTPSAKPKHKIKKLVPPRPFPTVPTSVSATGPRSAHKEGKNYICLTRKTPLGAYLRRCKDVILKDGYKTLHLSAMGAAIPHLATLVVSLPSILPFPADEIHTEISTGSVDVQDEVIPEDEDEDISYRTRAKSTLGVVIKIGNGDPEERSSVGKNGRGKRVGKPAKHAGGKEDNEKASAREEQPEQILFQEPEQEDMDVV